MSTVSPPPAEIVPKVHVTVPVALGTGSGRRFGRDEGRSRGQRVGEGDPGGRGGPVVADRDRVGDLAPNCHRIGLVHLVCEHVRGVVRGRRHCPRTGSLGGLPCCRCRRQRPGCIRYGCLRDKRHNEADQHDRGDQSAAQCPDAAGTAVPSPQHDRRRLPCTASLVTPHPGCSDVSPWWMSRALGAYAPQRRLADSIAWLTIFCSPTEPRPSRYRHASSWRAE